MESCVITNAKVYVTTKNRYDCHNRFGIWVELAEFKRKKEYLEYCKKLFPNESQPVLIHLDWLDIPSNFISETGISATLFRLIEQVGNMEDTQQKGFAVWFGNEHQRVYNTSTLDIIQSFEGSYMGYFGNELLFTEYYTEEIMGITKKGSHRFDFISYKNQLFREQFSLWSGFVFRK